MPRFRLTLVVPMLVALATLAGCGGSESDSDASKKDPDIAVCRKLLADEGPINKTLSLAENYVDTESSANALAADPNALADRFGTLSEPGSIELKGLVRSVSTDLNRIDNFVNGTADEMTDLSVLVDEIDAVLEHCTSAVDGGDKSKDGDSTSVPTTELPTKPKPATFKNLEQMRTAYEELTGTTCDPVETPSADSDVNYVLCDASTDDVSSDVLIYQLDNPGPVKDLAQLEIGMSSGTTSRVVAYALDWRWAVASASSERLSLVLQAFPEAAPDTLKSAD